MPRRRHGDVLAASLSRAQEARKSMAIKSASHPDGSYEESDAVTDRGRAAGPAAMEAAWRMRNGAS